MHLRWRPVTTHQSTSGGGGDSVKCGKGPLKGKQLEIVVTDHDGGIVVKMMVVLMRKKRLSKQRFIICDHSPAAFCLPGLSAIAPCSSFSFHLRNKARKTLGRKERKALVLYVFQAAAPKTGRWQRVINFDWCLWLWVMLSIIETVNLLGNLFRRNNS